MTTQRISGRRPRLLIFADYFLPGFQAGGPIKSIANIVKAFESEYSFVIVTRDHDCHGAERYFPHGKQVCSKRVYGARVVYVSEKALWRGIILHLLRNWHYDLAYFNSAFSPWFSIFPQAMRKCGLTPRFPYILAPRGEFSLGALAIHAWKKSPFLGLANVIGLYRDAIWHASTNLERVDIRRVFAHEGVRERSMVAPIILVGADLAVDCGMKALEGRQADAAIMQKGVSPLRIVFLSRISEKKNLDGALRILYLVRTPVQFDIVGPIEDKRYWSKCQALIEALPSHINVQYQGHVQPDEASLIFSLHDLFLFPTHGENFGHVIVESLVAGCAVMTSTETPWRKLEARNAGWTIPLNEPARYAATIDHYSLTSIEERERMRRSAKAFAQEATNSAGAVRRMRAIFEAALAYSR
jgi:glycosyltransferase involved in cell wall biosynthesis